jgi:hypothetical protein
VLRAGEKWFQAGQQNGIRGLSDSTLVISIAHPCGLSALRRNIEISQGWVSANREPDEMLEIFRPSAKAVIRAACRSSSPPFVFIF